ncbi:MAG: DNA replication/repair protein RecF [Oceanospirillaceae bacterium]|nr:DNA replication/repair protein RecF [Oceanospirillaceae bacterium]
MPIRQLSARGVRNLAPLVLLPHPRVNFIYGNNGSGKTSVLESVHLLSSGKSFRTHQLKHILNRDDDRLEVSIDLADSPDGEPGDSLYSLRLKNGDHLFRLNGSVLGSQADAATRLPVLVIEPNTFKLLSGSPEERRQFMDWGVFHVEASFIEQWRTFRSLLKQRNAVLKQKELEWLDVWNEGFIEAAEKIDDYRRDYLQRFKPEFDRTLKLLDPELEVGLSYYPGWEKNTPLADVLKKQAERELQLGFTQAGPHRAEIRIKSDKQNAADVLSRGQQKTVVAALKLAQGILFKESTGSPPIYLVDDLASELDGAHRLALCQVLEDLKCQVFITSIEKGQVLDTWQPAEYKVFHVEQGNVTEE